MKNILFDLVIVLFLFNQEVVAQYTYPFSKVEFQNKEPYVDFGDELAKLISIENLSIEEFITNIQAHDPQEWQEDFIKHMPRYLDALLDSSITTIKAKVLVDEDTITNDYLVKFENFEKALDHLSSSIQKNRISRPHQSSSQKYEYLTERRFAQRTDRLLSKKQVVDILEHLEWQIVMNYSYRDLTSFDYKIAIDMIISSVGDGIHERDFYLQLKMFMASFGDGHSDPSFYKTVFDESDANGNLPFEIVHHEDKFYAVHNENFKGEDHVSEIIAIEGIKIHEIYSKIRNLVPKSTEGYIQKKTLLYMSEIKFAMSYLGRQAKDSASVDFLKEGKITSQKFELGRHYFPPSLSREVLTSERLEDNIGVIRLRKSMTRDDDVLLEIQNIIEDFRDTKGLIIDVRRNSGGTRDVLRLMMPYFIQSPTICNLARYRIDSNEDFKPKEGYLDGRGLFYEWSDQYGPEEKKIIQKFKAEFSPSFTGNDLEFTDYHYLMLSPDAEKYYYSQPVVVLVDSHCFSATDIFAAAFKEADNVVLMGETTGGGSGATREFVLPHIGLEMKLSSMISYQPDGSLYDGNGVIPDLTLEYTLGDRIGDSDTFMEEAIRNIGQR